MVLRGSVAHVRKQQLLSGSSTTGATSAASWVQQAEAIARAPVASPAAALTHEVELRPVGPGASDVQLDSSPTSRRNSLK